VLGVEKAKSEKRSGTSKDEQTVPRIRKIRESLDSSRKVLIMIFANSGASSGEI
jgi:hypothetical protein